MFENLMPPWASNETNSCIVLWKKVMKICKSVSLFLVSLLSLFGCTDEKKIIYHFSGEEWNFNNKCSSTMDNVCVTFEFAFSDVSWGKKITIDGVTITDIFINNVVANDNEIYCDQN